MDEIKNHYRDRWIDAIADLVIDASNRPRPPKPAKHAGQSIRYTAIYPTPASGSDLVTH